MTRHMKICLTSFLAVMVTACHMIFPVVSQSAEDVVVTLPQALKAAFQKNPSIAASRYEVDALEAMVDQTASAYFPQVSNMTNYFRVGGDLPDMLGGLAGNFSQSPGGSEFPNLNAPLNIYSSNFFVSQRLYDFGKTSGNVESSRQQLAAGKRDLQGSISAVVLNVKTTYFEVLKKMQRALVAKDSLVTYSRHLEQAQALFETGIRPRIDVTKSTVDRARARLSLLKAGFAVRTARVDLENAIGGPPVKADYVLGSIPVLPPMPEDREALLREAQTNRPEIAALKDRIQAEEARLTAAGAGYWPTVSANGGYGWASTEFPLKDYWVAGVSLKWELFSGFRTQAEEKESSASLGRLKSELKSMALSVKREVLQAMISVEESHETIRVAKIALTEARENMDLARGRYSNGLADAIEFSDAEMNLTIAKNDLVDATYGYLQNLARLEYAVGGWRKSYGLVPARAAFRRDSGGQIKGN
jgi:outer membrane protein